MSLANPFVIPFAVVSALLLGVVAYGIVNRDRSFVAREFLVLVLAVATHTIAYTLELVCISLEAKQLCHHVVWLGIATTPSALLLLALRYSRRPVARWLAIVLVAVPVTTIALAWTNDGHHWLEGPAYAVRHGDLIVRQQSKEVLFWPFFLFASTCVLAALGIYAAAWSNGPPMQRRQARAIFLAHVFPWATSFVHLVSASPVRLTPLALGISAALVAWTMFHDGFVDLIPVARGTVFETIDAPIFVLDRKGRIVDANPAARALTTRSFVAGIAAREYLDLFDGRDWCEGTHAVTFAGRSFELRTMPLDHEGCVVSLHDVTDREALAQATRRALQARTDFIARMSHELRTPLQGTLGSLELLRRTAIDAQQSELIDAAHVSARVLLGLVDEVLDFEKLDGGVLLDAEDFDLRAIVHDVLDSVRAPAALKGLGLESDLSAVEDGALRGDPKRIRQIVLNLAANAVKFTPKGTVRIVASVVRKPNEMALVSIRVDDAGPGVPAQSLPRIFEPFVQLTGVQTRKADGVGLGLAICRRLADAMGAELELKNRAGGGLSASLTLELPCADEAALLVADHAGPGQALRGVRLLLVDDHPVSRAVVCQMMRELGASVVAVDSGAAAIDAASGTRFDVALVDLHMPEMDGLATTRALKATGSAPAVLVFTADRGASVREECLAAGAVDVVVKPATIAQLAAAVLRRTSPRRESRSARPPASVLVDEFARTYPRELDEMRRALAGGQPAQCRAIVHGLLGASSLLGYGDVVDLCHAAREAPTLNRIEQLQRACARAVTESRAPGRPAS